MARNCGDCKDALAHVGGGSIGADLAHTEFYVTQRTTRSGPSSTPVQHMEVYQLIQQTLIKVLRGLMHRYTPLQVSPMYTYIDTQCNLYISVIPVH